MTQEDKELLLKDLSARLPYKTIVQIDGCGIWDLRGIDHDDSAKLRDRVIVWHGKNCPSSKNSFPIIDCKPYLRPMSSMTDEEWEDYQKIRMIDWVDGDINGTFINAGLIVDWLNAHHFDYRGLIPMGLAIDATGLNIY